MRASRDMTRAEFRAALQRRGWRQVLIWIEISDRRSIGMVMINGKVNRRASLAYAIQKAEEAEKRSA